MTYVPNIRNQMTRRRYIHRTERRAAGKGARLISWLIRSDFPEMLGWGFFWLGFHFFFFFLSIVGTRCYPSFRTCTTQQPNISIHHAMLTTRAILLSERSELPKSKYSMLPFVHNRKGNIYIYFFLQKEKKIQSSEVENYKGGREQGRTDVGRSDTVMSRPLLFSFDI